MGNNSSESTNLKQLKCCRYHGNCRTAGYQSTSIKRK